MAWIESHQTIERHRKTKKLMRLMEWDLDTTIGKLHRFWWWCVDYAEDGDLRKFSDDDIGESVALNGEPASKFVEAMVASCWIDRDPHFRVHDWWDYVGPWLRSRYKRSPEKWETVRNGYVTTNQPDQPDQPDQPSRREGKKLPDFSIDFVEKADSAKKRGFNIYQLTNRFYKESNLVQKLPEKVLVDVLDEFFKRGDSVRENWPYFLRVLKEKSRIHFAGEEIKKNVKNERTGPSSISTISEILSKLEIMEVA